MQVNLKSKNLIFKIELLRQEMKTGFAETRDEVKSDINKLIIWIVSTGIAIVGLLLAFLNLNYNFSRNNN